MPHTPRLAILDQDREFAAGVRRELNPLGWRCSALDGVPSMWALARMRVHAILLDAEALGEEPLAWIARTVEELPQMRIVVCARASTLDERVAALRVGAEDWIVKPCDPTEAIARVEGAIRGPQHVGPIPEARPLVAGEVTISPAYRQAFAHGVSARLTAKEFSLLHLLAREQGHVVERARAYVHIWGYPMVRRDRSVDVHVRRIRGKLRRISPGWNYIHTHHQVGYCFRATREITGGAAEAIGTSVAA
jgi:DNA-binding response OmpR family regulator